MQFFWCRTSSTGTAVSEVLAQEIINGTWFSLASFNKIANHITHSYFHFKYDSVRTLEISVALWQLSNFLAHVIFRLLFSLQELSKHCCTIISRKSNFLFKKHDSIFSREYSYSLRLMTMLYQNCMCKTKLQTILLYN